MASLIFIRVALSSGVCTIDQLHNYRSSLPNQQLIRDGCPSRKKHLYAKQCKVVEDCWRSENTLYPYLSLKQGISILSKDSPPLDPSPTPGSPNYYIRIRESCY